MDRLTGMRRFRVSPDQIVLTLVLTIAAVVLLVLAIHNANHSHRHGPALHRTQ